LGDVRPTPRRRWSLTQQAFDALLDRLGPDREQAGVKFEELRRKLVQYFSYEGCALPDRWADETLDRVAKRLSDGSPIEEIHVFTRGVARMVLREARLADARDRNVKEIPNPQRGGKERDAECLEDCIASLPSAARELVEGYYLGDPESRVTARKSLAVRMGINMEALRSRALRVRRQLESCLKECRDKYDEARHK
jgi:hypothetical protein